MRYFNPQRTQFISQYAPIEMPFDDMYKVGAGMQQRQDVATTGLAGIDAPVTAIPNTPVHKNLIKQQQSLYGKADELSEKDNLSGEVGNVLKLQTEANRFNKGIADKAKEDYKIYNKKLEEADEEWGQYSQAIKQLWYNKYSGAGDDPRLIDANSIFTLPKNIDRSERTKFYANQINSNIRENMGEEEGQYNTDSKRRLYVNRQNKREYIDEKQAANMLHNRMLRDDDLITSEKIKTGKTGQELNNHLYDLARSQANLIAYSKESRDEKVMKGYEDGKGGVNFGGGREVPGNFPVTSTEGENVVDVPEFDEYSDVKEEYDNIDASIKDIDSQIKETSNPTVKNSLRHQKQLLEIKKDNINNAISGIVHSSGDDKLKKSYELVNNWNNSPDELPEDAKLLKEKMDEIIKNSDISEEGNEILDYFNKLIPGVGAGIGISLRAFNIIKDAIGSDKEAIEAFNRYIGTYNANTGGVEKGILTSAIDKVDGYIEDNYDKLKDNTIEYTYLGLNEDNDADEKHIKKIRTEINAKNVTVYDSEGELVDISDSDNPFSIPKNAQDNQRIDDYKVLKYSIDNKVDGNYAYKVQGADGEVYTVYPKINRHDKIMSDYLNEKSGDTYNLQFTRSGKPAANLTQDAIDEIKAWDNMRMKVENADAYNVAKKKLNTTPINSKQSIPIPVGKEQKDTAFNEDGGINYEYKKDMNINEFEYGITDAGNGLYEYYYDNLTGGETIKTGTYPEAKQDIEMAYGYKYQLMNQNAKINIIGDDEKVDKKQVANLLKTQFGQKLFKAIVAEYNDKNKTNNEINNEIGAKFIEAYENLYKMYESEKK